MGVIREDNSEVTFRLTLTCEKASHAKRQEKDRENNQCRGNAVGNILTSGATERKPL